MTGASRDSEPVPGPWRWIAALGLALALLAATASWSLAHYENTARGAVEARFDQRVSHGAEFVAVSLEELAARIELVATRELAGDLDDEDLADTVGDLGMPLAIVLDRSGDLLAASPPRDDLQDSDLIASYPHLAQATAGRSAVSDVVQAAGLPWAVVALAVPYDTPSGRRVFSPAFFPGATPLEAYLERLLPLEGARTYLLDGSGNVVLANTTDPSHGTEAMPALRAAMRTTGSGASGTYTHRGRTWHYAVEAVEGTDWTLVSTVAHGTLLASLKPSLWIARVGLLLVAISLLGALWLIRRIWQRDRTLRSLNQELDAAVAARSSFIDVASHELRTPVTLLHGFVTTLADRWAELTDDDKRQLTQAAHRSSDRLVDLVQDVLEVSRLHEGRIAPHRVPVPVATLVSDAVAGSAVEGFVEVACPGHLVVDTDPVVAHRILRNFLDNAARYGEPPFVVTADTAPGHIEITVSDAGEGVPPEFVPHLFQPFTRAQGRGSDSQGSGLGLAIAAGLAEELGGDVRYGSDPQPTFVLRLPKVAMDDHPSTHDEVPTETTAPRPQTATPPGREVTEDAYLAAANARPK